MPTLARILVYPIKSLDPAVADRATVLPSGALQHDRRWSIVDADGVVVNAKRTPRIHALACRYDLAARRIYVCRRDGRDPAEFLLDQRRAELERWLSGFFEFPVRLLEDAARGFPDDAVSPGPTVVSTATLETVAGWFDRPLDEIRLRFRANLEIDGVEPFWEDRLYADGNRTVPFRIGGVTLQGVNPCARCAVPARHPATGESLTRFQRRFADLRRDALPEGTDQTLWDHFYRLAVNTRLQRPEDGGAITIGDDVALQA